ncbi:hypothetical protein V1527DRAFT_449447 [Lipomyces starkeyi]
MGIKSLVLHDVMVRSAEKIKQAGAEVHRGDIEDIESLRAGAKAADGVVHLTFIYNFSNLAR